MRLAIYGRVSTSHQVEHQTIEQQLGRLTAHVGTHAAEGWAFGPVHVFRDEGYSGAALVRPGLDRLRDATVLYQRPYALTVLVHGAAATERMRSGVPVSQFQAAQQRSTMVS